MKIVITTDGPELDRELDYFAKCCAAFELGSQRGRIRAVRIHMSRAHEARDSRNRHCVVEIETRDGGSIVARDSDLDLNVAIYRALEGAGSQCAQQLARGDLDTVGLPIPPRSAAGSDAPDRAA